MSRPASRSLVLALVLPLSAASSACVSHSTHSDFAEVQRLVHERGPGDLQRAIVEHEHGAEPIDPEAKRLAGGVLTLDDAVRIALLDNRELRADLLSLGIARGQLVQASVFPNPDVDASLRFPEHGGDPHWELGVSISLTQLILRGGRSDVAEAELDAARVRAAGATLALAYQVRLAFYEALAAEQQLELARTAHDALDASYQAALALHAAGNVPELDLVNEQAAAEGARVAVAEAEADVSDARERLNVLLGFFGRDTSFRLQARLPDVPAAPLDATQAEARALDNSLELAQGRAELRATARRIGVTETAGLLPELHIGARAERDHGEWEVGPAIRGQLPVFDRGQGEAVSHRAELEALRERYLAHAVELRASVRAAAVRAASAEARARNYRDVLLPLRERVLRETMLHYNAMELGVFQVLQARQAQVEAGRMYVATLLEYWRARAALEQLVQGRLTGTLEAMMSGVSQRGAK